MGFELPLYIWLNAIILTGAVAYIYGRLSAQAGNTPMITPA